ncbi:MAG: hypothetical protein H0U02_10190 [Rubrobacter sp.]|nr:hypothetical protein [Rubrobacter sp.]MBA3790701.1 hypothetical protein [Rubrobacter sp.]
MVLHTRQDLSLNECLSWPRRWVARWVSAQPQPLVVGWPFNGTRRWYLLQRRSDPAVGDYVTAVIRRQAEQHRLVFEHGASVILAPCFGYELLSRGEEYTRTVLGGLLKLGDDAVNREMFENGVRLRFYGDYEEVLDTPEFRPLLGACEDLTAAPASGDGPLLLIGLFADAPHERLARLSVEFARQWHRPPNRRELIEGYYGVHVPDLSLYLGFSQPALFDVPLITTGAEDLYATLTPSPELTEWQWREILYDHLVLRRAPDADYEMLPEEALERLARYNETHREATLGVGRIDSLTGMWNPVLPGHLEPAEDSWKHSADCSCSQCCA